MSVSSRMYLTKEIFLYGHFRLHYIFLPSLSSSMAFLLPRLTEIKLVKGFNHVKWKMDLHVWSPLILCTGTFIWRPNLIEDVNVFFIHIT